MRFLIYDKKVIKKLIISMLSIFVVIMVLVMPNKAQGFSLWPFYIEKSLEDGSKQRKIFPPFGLWEKDSDGKRFGLLPFFLKEQDYNTKASKLYVLYPFFCFQKKQKKISFNSLMLLNYTYKYNTDEEKHFSVFPIYFYDRDEKFGSRWMFFPFWGTLKDFFGQSEIHVRLFPLYLKVTNHNASKTWKPFPFYATLNGNSAKGKDFFPFYGYEKDGERRKELFLMWPFHVRRFDKKEEGRWIYKLNMPIWGHLMNPKYETKIYGLYHKTLSHEGNFVSKGFLWPFVASSHDLESSKQRTLRVFPLFQTQNIDNYKAEFFLWPLWRFRGVEGGNYLYLRDDSIFFIYRYERTITLKNKERKTRFFGFMPFFHVKDYEETAMKFRIFSLFEQIFPYNETIELIWSPFWAVFEKDRWGYSIFYDFIHWK